MAPLGATDIMYHRTIFQTLLLSILLGALAFVPPPNALGESANPPLSAVLTISGGPDWPLPPTVKQLKKRPVGVEIFQFDKTPIGNRAPLLMVHGLLGEYWDTFRWRKLLNHLQSDSEFVARYKIVLARYDSHLPLTDVIPAFREAAIKVSDAFGGKPLQVVALSMGGNVVRDAMLDTKFDKRVKSVLTMGTPFHGSPLFTSNWMEYSMMKHYHSPLSRIDTALPYRLYFNRHKNLLADLHWDNSDKMIPDVGKFRYYFPMPSSGTLSAASTANTGVFKFNQPNEVDKSKFTVYSGFLLSDYALPKPPNELASLIKVPYRFTVTLLPEHLGREHPVLRALNEHIARAITTDNDQKKPIGPKYTYGLNDGIAPIVSSLYLPNASLVGLAVTQTNLLDLNKVIDVKRARLFKNIDHLTFIDDYHPLGAPESVKDELDPSASALPIFDWIKADLLK